jgi:cytochrome b pre-mRNA-processing protein 3
MFFKKLFGRTTPQTTAAQALYLAAVAKAREPLFYLSMDVADTVDGRFDMVVIHVMLIMRQLRKAGAAGGQVSQEMFDYMFQDMDRSLREMGVGDLSVGKHIKKMAKAFYTRAGAVEAGLDSTATGDRTALTAALADTLYRATSDVPGKAALADYLTRMDAHLAKQAPAEIAAGHVDLSVS